MSLNQRQQNQSYQMIQFLQEKKRKMKKEINIQIRKFKDTLMSIVDDNFQVININIFQKGLKKPQHEELEKQEQENVQEMQEKQILMQEKQSDEGQLNEQSNMLSLIMTQNNHTLLIRDQKNQSRNQINSKQISMQNDSQQLNENQDQFQHTKLNNMKQEIHHIQYTQMLANQFNRSQEKTQQQIISQNSQHNSLPLDDQLDKYSAIQQKYIQQKYRSQQMKQFRVNLLSIKKFEELSDQQSNFWIKKISEKEQEPIFIIDLTEFEQDNNNNKQKLKMYLNTYRRFQQGLRPIFIVEQIKLKSNFDQQLLKQILTINWNGLKWITLQDNKYWQKKMKKKQLKQFLELADRFSRQNSQISIVIQFIFVSSSYLEVIKQMDLKSQLILKVQYLYKKHQKILRKDKFKAAQKIKLQFKVSNKDSQRDKIVVYKLPINLEILQQLQIDQNLGYEQSCIVKQDNKTLKNKYQELKKIFLRFYSRNKLSTWQLLKKQYHNSIYQILENGNFKLNLFFSFDFEMIFQQHDWNQVQIIYFTKIITQNRFEMQYSLEQLDCETLALFGNLKYVLIDIQLLRNKQVYPNLNNIMQSNSLQYLDEKAFQKIYQYNSKQSSIPIVIFENYMSTSRINMKPEKYCIKKFKTFNLLKLHYMQRGYKFQQQKQIIVKQPQIQPKKQVYPQYFDLLNDKDWIKIIQDSYRNLKKGLQSGLYSPCSIY